MYLFFPSFLPSLPPFPPSLSPCLSVLRARSTQPVCSHLQAQLLTCYGANKGETLRCSELAKEYMRCINAAKKVRVRLPSPPGIGSIGNGSNGAKWGKK